MVFPVLPVFQIVAKGWHVVAASLSGALVGGMFGKNLTPTAKTAEKEISKDRRGVVIIDTNAFMDCVNIIDRVYSKGYSVVVADTVIEELDRQKLKYKNDDDKKKTLRNVGKQIKQAFDRGIAKMESGDTSLLPAGFDVKNADCVILSVALKHKKDGECTILLTSDTLLQSRASGLGIIQSISTHDFLNENKRHKF